MSNFGMSKDMYDFIIRNIDKINYDLDNGLVTTQKGTNGTVCSSTGYLRFKVNKKLLQVHQVLAVMYFGESCIGMQINHKDGNKLNNKKSNLEAITIYENVRHQIDNGLRGENPNKKEIHKFDLNGNFVCSYDSLSDACRDVGLKSSKCLYDCLIGKQKTAGGFKWSQNKILL